MLILKKELLRKKLDEWNFIVKDIFSEEIIHMSDMV